MDIKKDKTSGKYQISDADQTDDSYDLHGLMFEFSRHNDGEVFYQFEQKLPTDFCKKEDAKKVEPPAVVGPPEHKKLDFRKRCSGLYHDCAKCDHEDEHNLVEGGLRCPSDEFCF